MLKARFLKVLFACLFLSMSACGGGDSDDNNNTSSSTEARHHFSVSGTKATIRFGMVDGYIVNLANDKGAASLKLEDVDYVIWNGDVAQWNLSDDSPYASTEVGHSVCLTVPEHDIGIVRIVAKNCEVYSINTEKTILESCMGLDGRKLIQF